MILCRMRRGDSEARWWYELGNSEQQWFCHNICLERGCGETEPGTEMSDGLAEVDTHSYVLSVGGIS